VCVCPQFNYKTKLRLTNNRMSFASPDFFFKFFYVMKCLRSKKRKSALNITTAGREHYGSAREHYGSAQVTKTRANKTPNANEYIKTLS
jgi:hypothetical protein